MEAYKKNQNFVCTWHLILLLKLAVLYVICIWREKNRPQKNLKTTELRTFSEKTWFLKIQKSNFYVFTNYFQQLWVSGRSEPVFWMLVLSNSRAHGYRVIGSGVTGISLSLSPIFCLVLYNKIKICFLINILNLMSLFSMFNIHDKTCFDPLDLKKKKKHGVSIISTALSSYKVWYNQSDFNDSKDIHHSMQFSILYRVLQIKAPPIKYLLLCHCQSYVVNVNFVNFSGKIKGNISQWLIT